MAHAAALVRGFLLYVGYLTLFFGTWVANGVDYTRIGESAETTRLWYAAPTLIGCAFLVLALTRMGWWRATLFDTTRTGPAWAWLLPLTVAGLIAHNLLTLNWAAVGGDLLLWSMLGAVGVGFGEEMITRGGLVVGLRSRLSERRVWIISSLLFSALHAPNVLFGLPAAGLPIQLALTFIMGSGFYAMRRLSGTLLLPMVLHGLWDSALFLHVATGSAPPLVQLVVYPVAIVCVIGVLRRDAQKAHLG